MSHSRQVSISSSIASSSRHNHPQKIGPWKLGKTLGRGATGRVLLATHHRTGQKAAVKVVSKSELHDEDGERNYDDTGLPYGIEREIIIMKLLTHPNVLRLYDVWETSKALYLVLEYVEGGELFDLLVERGPLQEVEAIKYFRQIILGTAYCHALGICHRDLKPENLLLDAALNVKLADFGMAALESGDKLLETSCGSPHYAAPEIVSGLKYHGAASDIWSCGVILFALLTGRLPFDDENIRNLLLKVQAGNFQMPSDLSPEACDLIDKMLTVDPMERIPTDKILSHPLLVKYPIPNEDLISVKSLPHPETAYKSLGSEKNIDKQILANLSILWHDRPVDDIVRALLRNGQNPEKTFYALLMRYRHNQDSVSSVNSPQRAKRGIPRSTSSTKNTPRKKRNSIVASRPSSFQYKNNRASLVGTGKASTPSSVHNSPRKKYPQSPRKSPVRSARKSPAKPNERDSPPPAIPRNIYNEIVNAQKSQASLPPTLPSKDSYLANAKFSYPQGEQLQNVPKLQSSPDLKSSPRLQSSPDLKSQSEFKKEEKQKSSRGSGGSGDSRGSHPSDTPSSSESPAAPPPPPHGLQASADVDKRMSKYDLKRMSSNDLQQLANELSATDVRKRSSMVHSTSKNRLSRRKSLRASMTTGLKRNSITMKLLSTYAKLSGETDWEYMDKSTKRTSATFALLCDKIFNQEEYDEDEENLVDEEEKQAREYERLMELERKKHEAEMIARKELEKRRKRQKRRSLMSSKKLSVMIRDDDNNSELDVVDISQPKRTKGRSVSERPSDKPGKHEQKRSVTEPRQRTNPIVTRRPVSRLDPLWTAYENEQLTRAKEALDAEIRDSRKQRRRSHRESMVHRDARYSHQHSYSGASSVTQPRESVYSSLYSPREVVMGREAIEDARRNQYKRVSQYRDSRLLEDYDQNELEAMYGRRASRNSYRIPEPNIEDSDLSEEYMSEIRKSRLLNSQLNMHEVIEPKTLISNVKIPTVTRKSRHFSHSNKRLSVLSMYSTKESYRDLNSILNSGDDSPPTGTATAVKYGKAPALVPTRTDNYETYSQSEKDYEKDYSEKDYAEKAYSGYPEKGLRTSLADRLEYGAPDPDLTDDDDDEPLDQGSTMIDDHKDCTVDETFATKNDEIHRRGKPSNGTTVEDESDISGNVFDNIKLPDGKSSKSSVDAISDAPAPPAHRTPPKSMLPSAESMLIPSVDKKGPQAPPKVRKDPPKQPLEDTTNKDAGRSKGSIFRKLSWGPKKTIEEPKNSVPSASAHTAFAGGASTKEYTEPRPPVRQKSGFLRWFSSSEEAPDADVKRFRTVLPKQEMSTALYALLNSWTNFGLKNLRNDSLAYNITGGISSNNTFNLKSCKFRIKINARDQDQKSEIVCARVKGSRVTTDTLFKEIEKVLEKEGVLEK